MKYNFFIEKASYLIHQLLIGEDNSKNRLLANKSEIVKVLFLSPIPLELKEKRDELKNRFILKSNDVDDLDTHDYEKHSSIDTAILNLSNSEASALIDSIYNLLINVESYQEQVNKNL